MSRSVHFPLLRRSALAAILVGASQAAFAQSLQSLTLTFDASAAVPIGPWTSVAIAVVVAACGLAFLRRKGASTFAQVCLMIATGGVLAMIPPVPEADATAQVTQLVTSPTTVSPILCPQPTNFLYFQNATGHTTVIRGVTLAPLPPAGVCTIGTLPPGVKGALQQSDVECTAGLALAAGAQCVVTIFNNQT